MVYIPLLFLLLVKLQAILTHQANNLVTII